MKNLPLSILNKFHNLFNTIVEFFIIAIELDIILNLFKVNYTGLLQIVICQVIYNIF